MSNLCPCGCNRPVPISTASSHNRLYASIKCALRINRKVQQAKERRIRALAKSYLKGRISRRALDMAVQGKPNLKKVAKQVLMRWGLTE